MPAIFFQGRTGGTGGTRRRASVGLYNYGSGFTKHGTPPLDALRNAPGCPRTSEKESPSMGTADKG